MMVNLRPAMHRYYLSATRNEGKKFQVSRFSNYPVNRYGIFNEEVDDIVVASNYTRVTLDLDVKQELQKFYLHEGGQPFVVRFYENGHSECHCFACCMGVLSIIPFFGFIVPCIYLCCGRNDAKVGDTSQRVHITPPTCCGCCSCRPPQNVLPDYSGLEESATEIWFGKRDRVYDKHFISDCKAKCGCFEDLRGGEEDIERNAVIVYVPRVKVNILMWSFQPSFTTADCQNIGPVYPPVSAVMLSAGDPATDILK